MSTSQISSNQRTEHGYVGTVRTVAMSVDQYSGLKGHDYIKARNLNQPVQRMQTSAHVEPRTAEVGK